MIKQVLDYLSNYEMDTNEVIALQTTTKAILPEVIFYDTRSGKRISKMVIAFGKSELLDLSKAFPDYDFGMFFKNSFTKMNFLMVASNGKTLFEDRFSYMDESLEDDANVVFERILFNGDVERDTLVGETHEDVFDFILGDEILEKVEILKSLIKEGQSFDEFTRHQESIIKRGDSYFSRK